MDLTDRTEQAFGDSLVWFPKKADDLLHQTLGLVGEAGEVGNEVKKWDRGDYTEDDGFGSQPDEHPSIFREKVAKELADVLVYTFNVAAILGIDLEKAYDDKRAFNEERFGNGRS